MHKAMARNMGGVVEDAVLFGKKHTFVADRRT